MMCSSWWMPPFKELTWWCTQSLETYRFFKVATLCIIVNIQPLHMVNCYWSAAKLCRLRAFCLCPLWHYCRRSNPLPCLWRDGSRSCPSWALSTISAFYPYYKLFWMTHVLVCVVGKRKELTGTGDGLVQRARALGTDVVKNFRTQTSTICGSIGRISIGKLGTT